MTDQPKNYGIIGIGLDHQIYTRATLSSPWVLVPNSAAVISVIVMPDGKLMGVGKDYQLWMRDTLASNWVQVPNSGEVIDVDILPDGRILGVGNNNNQLFTRDTLPSRWVPIPNSGAVMSVAVMPSGKIIGVGMDHQLYVRDTLQSAWVNVPNSGAVLSAAADTRKEPEPKTHAIDFNGKNDRIELRYPVPSITTAVTVEFWAKGGSNLPSNNSVFSAFSEQTQRMLNIHLPWGNGDIYWDAGNQNGCDRIQKPVQPQEYKGIWTHWAFVKDATKGQMFIYRNGTLWQQGSGMTRPMAGIKHFHIGLYADGSLYWHGSLAEFRIWNKACTEQEIKNNLKLRMTGKEENLVAYYPMDAIAEGKERKLMDLSANGYHGTLFGNPVLTSEFELSFSVQAKQEKLTKPSKGILLDGQKDDVEVPYHVALNPEEFTLTCWVKPTRKQGVWRSVVSSSSPKRGYMLYAGDDDKWQFWVGTEKLWYKLIGSEVVLDQWAYLAATYSNGTMKLYVDGKLAGELKGKYTSATNPLRIGSGDADVEPKFFFTGQIAEVCIWKKVLSADDILSNMDIKLTGKETNLTAYWPMNTIVEATTERKTPDMTAHGNHGLVRGDVRLA